MVILGFSIVIDIVNPEINRDRCISIGPDQTYQVDTLTPYAACHSNADKPTSILVNTVYPELNRRVWKTGLLFDERLYFIP